MGSRKPTHDLCIIANAGAGFQKVGIGWKTRKGSISLRLLTGVTLTWRDMDDHSLYVVKNEEEKNGNDQENE